jgi:cyclophilin family peptidyl-prolyl cis-trans isomerase
MGVQGLLRGLATSEVDPIVRGTLARTLGRLPYPDETVARAAAQSIAERMDPLPSAGALAREPWVGILHGTDALLRRFPALRTAPGVLRVADTPRVPTIEGAASSDSAWSREANVILAAIRGRVLGAAPSDEASIRGIRARFLTDFGDGDPQVRRQVASQVALAAALDDAAKSRIITAALADRSASVRIEGVRAYARTRGASCAPLITATRDVNALVALTALDALAAPCEPAADGIARLGQVLRELPRGATGRTGVKGSWHYGAHAAVSLARVAPDSVRRVMSSLASHAVWQVRMYAGRAAAVLGDTGTLTKLAADPADNVRDAAVNGFADLMRPPAGASAGAITRSAHVDSVLLAQFARSDYQLILNAAKALEGSTLGARGYETILATLDRLTDQRRETSRDPRLELLARLESARGGALESRVRPYLNDYDPAIASRTARVYRTWGRADVVASPRPLPHVAVSHADAVQLRTARVRITMAPQSGGGSFEIRLFADEAPATVTRFVALARRGYYNGLTFHRMATNFVIQGGSPGANEYVGADRFMRDEVGLRSHERGTLGISTRGRDTGDAQIFVNLIDNWRLDHDYTVFAEVVRGMDVVDGVLEGDTIARIEVLSR